MAVIWALGAAVSLGVIGFLLYILWGATKVNGWI
jgi:hypothetical protein